MIQLDTGRSAWVWGVAFHPDGRHFLGGGREQGIRRWRLANSQEVGEQTGVTLQAISVSKDHKWIVCGSEEGASVWNEEMLEKVIDVEGENEVLAVDVSPDSTSFATGTSRNSANIWSIRSGERLVGPLKHDSFVTAIQFSPNGEHIATACLWDSIRIFDSHTGDELVTIETNIPNWLSTTPLAWSSNARQIFVASHGNKIRSYNISTRSLLAELQIHHDGDPGKVHSIALAANNKFIATSADCSIFFLDTSTLTRIGPVIEDGEPLGSITISADSSHLATGRADGKIIIRDLSKILPDSYGPFHVSIFYDLGISNNPHFVSYGDNYNIGSYPRGSTTR